MTITTTKSTTINFTSEKEAIQSMNERIRAINEVIRAKNAALPRSEKMNTLKTIPVMASTCSRNGVEMTLAIEKTGIKATFKAGASRVVMFYSATEKKWMGLYDPKQKDRTINRIEYSESGEKFVNALNKAARGMFKTFNLDKMNTTAKCNAIAEECANAVEMVRATVETLEKRFGLVKGEPTKEAKTA